jgi:zinc/manganese transport system substrate-binding protein
MNYFRKSLLALSALVLSTHVIASEPSLRIVTGNTVVQDIVQEIGGERISATCLLQAGVDPHSYQPVPEDVKRIASAQLVIINGLGFEGWFAGLAKESGYRGLVVTATRGIEALKMEDEDGHEAGGAAHGLVDDPHAFNSIVQGVRYAENIRDALISADPSGADAYQAAAATYIASLRAADAKAKQLFSTIPKAQRKLVTNHDALQYFAKEYGFEIVAPNTALEDSQPSAKDLAEIIAFIRKQGVKSVFLEFGKQEKIVEQIAKEAGVRIGPELYLDGVGPAGTPAATYLGMFMHNVQAIADGLR